MLKRNQNDHIFVLVQKFTVTTIPVFLYGKKKHFFDMLLTVLLLLILPFSKEDIDIYSTK